MSGSGLTASVCLASWRWLAPLIRVRHAGPIPTLHLYSRLLPGLGAAPCYPTSAGSPGSER